MSDVLLVDWCVGNGISMNLTESTKGPGATKFRGKFQEANTVNKNRRMYPLDILEQNVGRLKEAISGRGLVGELDHPTDSIVHFENASHLITKLWWEGNVLMGEGEVLPTPAGKVLKGLIDAGVRVGISSRGVGNGQVNNEGVLVIGESYKLITFDAVADPSTPSAFQQKIGNESFIPTVHEAKRIRTVSAKTLISFLGCVFESTSNNIKGKIQ